MSIVSNAVRTIIAHVYDERIPAVKRFQELHDAIDALEEAREDLFPDEDDDDGPPVDFVIDPRL